MADDLFSRSKKVNLEEEEEEEEVQEGGRLE